MKTEKNTSESTLFGMDNNEPMANSQITTERFQNIYEQQ